MSTTLLSDAELRSVAERLAAAGVDPAGPLTSRLITGGRSNLTYRLDDGTSAWVLRMPPRAGRTPSAHDVAREYRVTSALRRSAVPVPPTVVLCEDDSVIGSPFAITEFVTGHTIQSRADLAALDDATVATCVTQLVGTLAALHSVDHLAVGLEQFGRPDQYAERQIRRWASQWEIVGIPGLAPMATQLRDVLRSNPPRQHATGIVHGDYRIDNTLLVLGDDPRVAAVVDWELSTIGDPIADVAMMCVYRDPALDLVIGEPCAWTSNRLPAVDELGAAYERAGGVALEDWDRHLALGYFKLAVIAAGINHRFTAGATQGRSRETAGDAVRPLLEAGLARLTA